MTFLIIYAIVVCVAAIIFAILHKMDVFDDEDDEKMAKKIFFGALAGLFIVISIFQIPYMVGEQQVACKVTLGKAENVEQTGLNFRVPFLTRVYKYDGTIQGMAIGYIEENDEPLPEDAMMITNDFNFVNVDFYVTYRVVNPVEYKFGTNDPEGILYSIAQSCIRNTVGLYGVDDVLTTGKAEIEMRVKETMSEKLAEHHTGLFLQDVKIQDAEPPTEEVSAAFRAVENAKQKADTVLNDARSYENEQIPQAKAEADKLVREAEAMKAERENQAYQEVAEFEALYKEYQENPDTVMKKLYYETMEEILPNMNLIIGNSEIKLVYVDGSHEEVN